MKKGKTGSMPNQSYRQLPLFKDDPAMQEPRARAGDPETSVEAAQSVRDRSILQEAILKILKRYGAKTDERIAQYLFDMGMATTPSGMRTRRRELVQMGMVQDTGKRRRTKAGRNSIVWGLARKEA